MKTKKIFSWTMAEYLVDQGCNLIRIVPDLLQANKSNWLFEDNDYLQEQISAFMLTRNKR